MQKTHIIVLPGGGYSNHAAYEAEPVASWLMSVGAPASVFRYPVSTIHPGPTDAILDEVKRVRTAGAQRVGVLGFSAGGHAAGLAALSLDAQLDLAILCYPVVSMELETHAGSQANLLGRDPTSILRAQTSLNRLVTDNAPPFFIWHTASDGAVPVEHSYLLGLALAEHGVDHALHVFARGDHGLGLAAGQGPAASWTSLCEDWLREQRWI